MIYLGKALISIFENQIVTMSIIGKDDTKFCSSQINPLANLFLMVSLCVESFAIRNFIHQNLLVFLKKDYEGKSVMQYKLLLFRKT